MRWPWLRRPRRGPTVLPPRPEPQSPSRPEPSRRQAFARWPGEAVPDPSTKGGDDSPFRDRDARAGVGAEMSGPRGHAFFRLPSPIPDNGEDLRRRDCVISTGSERLLGTDRGPHVSGRPIWCPREENASGCFGRAQRVGHGTV